MLCVRRWSDARLAAGVGKYNAKSPKQGIKRFYSITKSIHFAHLGILFVCAVLHCRRLKERQVAQHQHRHSIFHTLTLDF